MHFHDCGLEEWDRCSSICAETRGRKVAEQRVVHVGRAEVWTGGIAIGRDQRLIQRGIAGKGPGEDQAVAGLNVYRSGKQAGIGAAGKALRNVDLGVYIFVATHKIDEQVAGDRGQVTVTGAVEGHPRIALKSGWNES